MIPIGSSDLNHNASSSSYLPSSRDHIDLRNTEVGTKEVLPYLFTFKGFLCVRAGVQDALLHISCLFCREKMRRDKEKSKEEKMRKQRTTCYFQQSTLR